MRSIRHSAFLLALAATLLTIACDTTRLVDQTGESTWTSVSPHIALLDAIGATMQLNVVDGSGAQLSVPGLTWRTLEAAVVQIDGSGHVTAVAPGIARIVVETANHADTATIEVRQEVAAIVISPANASVNVGATQQLIASTRDRNGHPVTGRAISWASSDENIALVTAAGLVMGRAIGTTVVSAMSGGKAGSAFVTIVAPPPPPPPPPAAVATISVTPTSATVEAGSTIQMTATLRDANGAVLTGRTVIWTSANENIALVTAGGLVMGRTAGSAAITASSEGRSGSASITVTVAPPPPPAPVATVTVTPAPASVQLGSTVQLTATLRDAAGNVLTGRDVTWTTSASGVATVSATGLVTGVAAGSATITATSEGKSGTASVTVMPIPVASVVVAPSTGSIQTGQTIQFTATPHDASGNALSGRSVSWTTSNAGVAQVSSSGLVSGASAGTATITATSEGRSGTASVTVTTVPVASVSVTPATGTIQSGQTIQLTATPRDANGNALTGRSVSWQSSSTSIATVSTTGLVAGQAAGVATITATSEGRSSTSAITVNAAPPPPAGSVNLRVSRLASGTGAVLVSSGIPLAPGRLRASELATIQILVGGQEPTAVYVEGLSGTHADGSLRAVLVQFNHNVPAGTALSAQLVFGRTRTAPALSKPTADRGNPAAVILPFEPTYLISTDIVGATQPATVAAAISPVFQKYEADFRTYADYHWNLHGAVWSENYYDRALIYYAWWVRTGELEYWRRATAMALAYRRDYLEANGFSTSPHWSQPEGLEKHFLLTGDEASRTAVSRVAERLRPGFHPTLGSTTSWWENRIQARLLQAYFLAWRLQVPGANGPVDWAALLDDALPKILSTQTADGSYRFACVCGESLNFMAGLLNDMLIKYYTYYKPDARIPPAIRRSVDYMWATQWIPNARAFNYLSGPCPGEGGPTAAPDLNNLILTGYAWTYRQTGNAIYRDRAEQIFAGGVAGAYLQGSKQFNENYSASYQYPAYRR